jgi:hypothetical protein
MDNKDNNIIAKRHELLDKFFEEVKKGFVSSSVTIYGYTFNLQLGDEDADVWADNFIKPNSPVSFVSSRRTPRLATAITSVVLNGQTITLSDLFKYDNLTSDQKKLLDDNQDQKKYWLWGQMLTYLLKLPTPIIERLYKAYDELITQRTDALNEAIANPN